MVRQIGDTPERWLHLEPQDLVSAKDSDQRVRPQRGASGWNGFRDCWISAFTKLEDNSSYQGELWYAEADAPEGPWKNAIKIVTHNNDSFHNPQLHQDITGDKSPVLLFETPTPRHGYDQVLYRLDLDSL